MKAKYIVGLIGCLALAGCSNVAHKEVNVDPVSANPDRKPVYNQTNMDQAIQCLDRQIQHDQKIQKVRIYVDSNFPDLAAAGVNSTRDMLITALMKLSTNNRKIGAIIFTQGSDLGFMSDASPGGAAFRFPQYFLRGAITQAQKAYSTGGTVKSLDVRIPDVIDIGKKDAVKDSVSSVGLDLHLGELNTLELIPGLYSSNMLSVVQRDEAGSQFAGLIDKVDYQYDVSFTDKEGMGAAVRALAELGVIEVVGKLFNLDYQSCVNPQQSQVAPQVVKAETPKSDDKVATDHTFALKIDSERGSRPVYSIGDTIKLRVEPQSDMNVYCFYQNGKEREIHQLYPNPYAPQSHLQQYELLSLPSLEMPFVIEANSAGQDQFACFGTRTQVTDELRRWTGGEALTPMTNVTLSDVEDALRSFTGEVPAKQSIVLSIK